MRFIKKIPQVYFKTFLNNFNFKNLNYSIDTWKLLNIERILVNLKDNVYDNNSWHKQILFYKKSNFLNFINYIYILNFYATIINYSWLLKNKFLKQPYFNFTEKNLFNLHIFKNNKFKSKYKNLLFFKMWKFNNQFYINLIVFIKTYLIKIKINEIKIVKKSKTYIQKQINEFLFKINIINWKNNKHFKNKFKFSFFFKPLVFYTNINNNLSSLLKKQKIYTKNKYSRSRQYCKNIVLFGLLLNIILMFGLNSAYYAILINTGYFILIFYCFLLSASIFLIKKYKLLSWKTYF